jgi:hypothetical protein
MAPLNQQIRKKQLGKINVLKNAAKTKTALTSLNFVENRMYKLVL